MQSTDKKDAIDIDEKKKKSFWQNKNQVFVKGLPFNSTIDDIKFFFRKCGEIKNITRKLDDKNRWTGSVHIRFTNKESIVEALKLDSALWEGNGSDGSRFVRVVENDPKKLKSKKNVQSKTEVIISNLPDNTNELDITKLLERCGKIKSIKLKRKIDGKGNITQENRDFAHIEFFNVENKIAALRLKKEVLYIKDNAIKINVPNEPGSKKKRKRNDSGEKLIDKRHKN